MIIRSIVATVMFAVLPAGLSAQTQSLVGITSAGGVITQNTTNCQTQRCVPAGFPSPGGPIQGGTAHDPTTSGTWISDGLRIAKIDANCGYQCPPQPMPNTTPNNPVTGLAYDPTTATLWVCDASNVIRWYTVNGCGLTLAGRCLASGSIPNTHTLAGLAVDSVNGLIFFAASPFAGPAAVGNLVLVANLATPCQAICRLMVNTCNNNPLRPLTGLAYEACRSVVWATDGRQIVGARVDVANCAITEIQCCQLQTPTNEAYAGLALRNAGPRRAGSSCTAPSCPNCANLQHVLGGDPVLGNPAFSLDLINAPANSRAWVLFNGGPCNNTGPGSPPLCGPVLIPVMPTPIAAGPFPVLGIGACTGSTQVSLPVPNSTVLCNSTFSTQFVGLCFSAVGPGSYVSNCLSWVVTSN